MGSEHSTARNGGSGALSPTASHAPNSTLVDPLYAMSRDGALSPERQESICSESSEAVAEVPYVSYTVNQPIGDSPKKSQAKTASAAKFRLNVGGSRASVGRRFRSGLGTKSVHNTMVMVNQGLDPAGLQSVKDDPELARLEDIPSFLPIMRASLSGNPVKDPDILERLDYRGLLSMGLRIESHMRAQAGGVSTDQAELSQSVREVDQRIETVTRILSDRQKKYAKCVERLAKIQDMSKALDKCHILLNENIEQMEILNHMLPPDDRLEPFVWTTTSS